MRFVRSSTGVGATGIGSQIFAIEADTSKTPPLHKFTVKAVVQ